MTWPMHLRCLADSRSKYHHQQNGCGHWATADVDIIEIMIRGCECCRRVSSSLWSVVVVVVATVVWCCVIVVVVHPRTRCCHHRNGLAIGPDPALTVSRMRVLGARKAIVIIIIGCHVVVAIPVNPDQCELLKKDNGYATASRVVGVPAPQPISPSRHFRITLSSCHCCLDLSLEG